MATARPGWSRRAQYGLFFSFLAVIAGIVVGLILLGLSLVAPKTFESVRGAALDVTGPVAGALHEVTATTEGVFTGAGNYWDAARQNSDLKRERKFMLQRMVEAKAILLENQQLKATLQLREHERSAIAVGRIVGSSFNCPRRFAILSVGASDGVRVGMPVRSPDGLVGRIIDAGALASRVCWFPIVRTSSPHGCCAAGSRSLRKAVAMARSTSARSRSAATRSSAATSSSHPARAGFTRRLCRSRGS